MLVLERVLIDNTGDVLAKYCSLRPGAIHPSILRLPLVFNFNSPATPRQTSRAFCRSGRATCRGKCCLQQNHEYACSYNKCTMHVGRSILVNRVPVTIKHDNVIKHKNNKQTSAEVWFACVMCCSLCLSCLCVMCLFLWLGSICCRL